MIRFCQNLLTASIHGSVVILAVMLLRLLLKKTPRKYICFLWMLAGIRLLMPISVQSAFSLQPTSIRLPAIPSQLVWIVWGCVAALIVAGSLLAYLRLQKQVKGAVKVRGGYESDQIETAFVLGFFKPKIYIPSGMSPAARTQILAHERTHLEKGDHWIKVIAFLALALHWFNPLVWVAYLMLCKDIEIACDERVVQFMELDERKQYASALLQCSTNRIYYAACPVAFGEVSVKYRIKSALSYRKPAVWMSLMGVLSIAFVSLCLLTNPAQAVSDPQAALQQSSHQAPESLSFAEAPALEPNPDWGITLYMDATSPTGGYFACVVEERFILGSESMTIGNSHLERWNGTAWEQVEGSGSNCNVVELNLGFAQSRNYSMGDYGWDVDWALNYGALPAGDYRIVMTVSSDTESATFQTGFRIYREKLPDAEEDALTRCTNALNALSSKDYYSVLLSEESPAGNIRPIRQLVCNGDDSSVTYYYGEFEVSNGKIEKGSDLLSTWTTDYQLNQNRKFLFPEGKSKISQEEISFCSAWADCHGNIHHGTDTFRFKPNGNLLSVDRIDETLAEDGTVSNRSHIRLDSKENSLSLPSQYVPQDSFTAQQRSPWGIFFRVDDDLLRGWGGEVWFATNITGVSKITTDCHYWIEKWETDRWVRLGDQSKESSWGEETIPVMGRTTIVNVDWSDAYGTLDAGIYRMGKRFYQGDEYIIQYAEFSIPLQGGIHGEGTEEALARVDAAIEALKQKGFRMEQYSIDGSEYYHSEDLQKVIWRNGSI
jgi:antirepressor regulating drug resistance, predicted signal transduction N-terminal membrane component